MLVFETTDVFKDWLFSLRDMKAKARILARIRSAEFGNLGDCSPVGEGVSEMRIHYGPGYRLYFKRTATLFISCWPVATSPARSETLPPP
jgi:putative addiction module killer protein